MQISGNGKEQMTALGNAVVPQQFYPIFQVISEKRGTTMKIKAIDVANIMLSIAEKEGLTISNLHLQKLLYYSQGFSYVFENRELFEDDFEAWKYGPSIPRVYNNFRVYGASPVKPDRKIPFVQLSAEAQETLKATVQVVGRKDPWELVEKVQSEAPWKNNYRHSEDRIISKEDIKDYFQKAMNRRINHE